MAIPSNAEGVPAPSQAVAVRYKISNHKVLPNHKVLNLRVPNHKVPNLRVPNHKAEFLITKFLIIKFLITQFHITEFLIIKFLMPEFLITKAPNHKVHNLRVPDHKIPTQSLITKLLIGRVPINKISNAKHSSVANWTVTITVSKKPYFFYKNLVLFSSYGLPFKRKHIMEIMKYLVLIIVLLYR